jgi:hypothetical protein
MFHLNHQNGFRLLRYKKNHLNKRDYLNKKEYLNKKGFQSTNYGLKNKNYYSYYYHYSDVFRQSL